MPRTARIASGGVIFHVLNRANALGKPDSLVKPHLLTQALGRTRTKRHHRYQALFHAPIDADGLTDIRAACQTGTPLGNDAFKAKIERKLHCQVGQARCGRPTGLTKGSDPLSYGRLDASINIYFT